MIYNVVITTPVYFDLEQTYEFYENKTEGLGKKFELEFWVSLEVVQKRPFAFRKRYKQYRQMILTRFPYAIIYEVINEDIIVYRIDHLKRHPKKRYKF